ncbi:pyruvate synthase subunit PorB [archaeon BMS3Abin16]|nr:pyruvate synthase subunit PorB [archaeon BMS3Abin16]HDY73898.1 pyruvate synthase subunit beta [Euryarchaeota archaeon]
MEIAADIPSYVRCRQKCETSLIANRCWKFSQTVKEVSDKELFASGHRACAGCGGTLAIRYALKALGPNTICTNATGCMEVVSSPYPEISWKVPWIHQAFENSAASASGVESALKALGRKKGVNVVAFGGDGGTFDIGLQSLSGAMERGHDLTYICYDNEAYMNTGVQRSGSTPYGAMTTTSPPGKLSFGEDRQKKDMPHIIAAHGVPYVATASVALPLDYMAKVKKAAAIEGPAYVQVYSPCPVGWGSDPAKSIEIGRLAVDTGMIVLYEIENGVSKVSYRPPEKIPVREFLKTQKRFRHLTDDKIAEIQGFVDERWDKTFR